MVSLTRQVVFTVAAGLLLSAVILVTPARASHVSCSALVTTSIVLDSDVGPCSDDGLIVTADNVVVDLNGHTIFGTDAFNETGVGIRLTNRTGVTITNGTITKFDAGVALENSSGNTVENVTVRDNIGAIGSVYRDGIAISGAASDNNQILDNVVDHNGGADGIGMFGGSSADKITGNVISGNLVTRNNINSQTGGIRIENWSWSNTISGNTVTHSSLEGIALFADTESNTVVNNVVSDNGYTAEGATHRKGDGIRSFARSGFNLIEGNTVTNNAGNGIFLSGPVGANVGSHDNTVTGNTATGNSAAPTVHVDEGGVVVKMYVRGQVSLDDQALLILPPPSNTYDLGDGNANCDNNAWTNNTYGTRSQACIN